MSTYRDTSGYNWAVNIDVKTLKEIRRRVSTADGEKVDLLRLDAGKVIANLMTDPCMLTDVLWICNEAAAKNAGITEEQFYARHRGEVFADAMEALLEALIDFFPKMEGLAYKLVRKAVREKRQQETERMEAVLNPPPESEPEPKPEKKTTAKATETATETKAKKTRKKSGDGSTSTPE